MNFEFQLLENKNINISCVGDNLPLLLCDPLLILLPLYERSQRLFLYRRLVTLLVSIVHFVPLSIDAAEGTTWMAVVVELSSLHYIRWTAFSVETECKTVNDSTSDMEVEVIIQQVQRCNKPAMKPSTCFKNLKTTNNNDNYYNNWILFRGIQYGFSEAPEKIKSGESWAKKKREYQHYYWPSK